MFIRRAGDMPGQPVAMDGVKDVSMRLMVGRDDGAPSFAMRHFTVEPGGHTPRHRHNYEHEVYVVEGTGRFEHDGEFHTLTAGDVLFVEPNVIHQFVNESDAAFTFLCLVPTTFDCATAGSDQPVPGS